MISGVIGLIVLIFKPVRSWFVNLIMRTTKCASDGIKTDVESIKRDVGELKDMIAQLTKKMNRAAAELNFEEAAQLRDELKKYKIALRDFD